MQFFVIARQIHGKQVYFVDFAGRNKSCGVITEFLDGAKKFEHKIVAQEIVCELNCRECYADNPWMVMEI